MKVNLHNLFNNKHKRYTSILIIVFCVGMVMVILTNGTKEINNNSNEVSSKEESSVQEDPITYGDRIEKKLEDELSKIDGVGKVEVTITVKTKGEVVFEKDTPAQTLKTLESDGDGGSRESEESDTQESTVVLKQSDGSEEPIVVKEIVPEINGVLIIAEGGGDLSVKNNLILAAKVLLDLPANKIEVMKMVLK